LWGEFGNLWITGVVTKLSSLNEKRAHGAISKKKDVARATGCPTRQLHQPNGATPTVVPSFTEA
jgi:hypothetical protein